MTQILAPLDALRTRARHLGIARIATVLGLTAIGVTGAFALPARQSAMLPLSSVTTVGPLRQVYRGGGLDRPLIDISGDENTAGITRLSGEVGPDLSQSLIAAGVPEAIGREYIAVLRRAIDLSDGLSVKDRFDLVLDRGSAGQAPQLAYVGLDRIARADVTLLKWSDGKHFVWTVALGSSISSALGRATSKLNSTTY